MTIGPQDPTGLNIRTNGPLTGRMAHELGFGEVGCQWRGSTRCLTCEYADSISRLCDYQCWKCDDREACPCGQKHDWEEETQ